MNVPIHLAGFLPSVILTAVGYLILRRVRVSMWGLALLALPGTVAHELAHFVVGVLLLAKPTGFSLWPKRSGDGWTLGSVTFRGINVFNGAFVALAPLLFLPLAWFCLRRLAAPLWVKHQWGWWFAVGYLLSTILFAAIPSLPDIKEARPSLLFYGIIGGFWRLLSSSVWQSWFH